MIMAGVGIGTGGGQFGGGIICRSRWLRGLRHVGCSNVQWYDKIKENVYVLGGQYCGYRRNWSKVEIWVYHYP